MPVNVDIDEFGLWWIFLDIPIFCVIILVFYYWRFFQNKSALPHYMTMRFIILGVIIFTVMDTIFDLISCKMLSVSMQYFSVFYLSYNYVVFICSLLWFRLARRTLGYKKGPLVVGVWISIIMCVVLTVLYFLNIRDFCYQENGDIVLGPLDALWYVFEYLPILWTFVLAQTYFLDKRFLLLREKCFPLLVSAYLFLIFGFLQYLVDSFPVFEVGVTLAIMYLYQSLSNTLISVDELTDLKNRRQLFKDMSLKLIEKSNDTYLIIYDLNKFKDINDTYGHTEGDYALIAAASTMKEICQGRNAQAYRYGGDEFVVLKELGPGENIDAFCADMMEAMHYKNLSMQKPYAVELSYGVVRFGDCPTGYLSDIIKLADQKMYAMKVVAHAMRR